MTQNIKSRVSRHNVLNALEKTMNHLGVIENVGTQFKNGVLVVRTKKEKVKKGCSVVS
ncbi:MAG: hypothetical protein QMD12_02765 [Candidatus Aenigmarchaeota archaeon]|nr:hypothetical protein [Candidatus Aenigmarchaeota archaeon]